MRLNRSKRLVCTVGYYGNIEGSKNMCQKITLGPKEFFAQILFELTIWDQTIFGTKFFGLNFLDQIFFWQKYF